MDTSRIEKMLAEQGKSKAHVARLLGKDRSYLTTVRNYNINLTHDALCILAADLGTTPEYLNWETDDPAIPSTQAVKIPVLGEVAAGLPIEAVEDIIDWEEIPAQMAKDGEYYGLVIKGRSMEPRMIEGDVVIVRKQETCDNGQLAIVAVNGDRATCKKVMLENDGLRLVSLNPLFPDQVYSKAAVEQLPITILGVVVELRAKF